MATDKKLYINKDTEFAEGISITQGGKPIGGGDGLPTKVLTAQEFASTKHLSDWYTEFPDQYVYYYVQAATAVGAWLILKIGYRTSNNTYTVIGFCSNAGNTGSIYKVGLTPTDMTTLTLSKILSVADGTNAYGRALAPRFQAIATNTVGLAGIVHVTKDTDPEQHYSVNPTGLMFDNATTDQVLGREGQWITPKVVYNDIQRSQAQVESDCELKNQNIIFELNYEEIVNRVLQYQDDLQFNGYVMSKYFHDDWVDIDGYTDYNKGNPEINFVVNLKGSTVSNEFTLFTYNQSSGSFTYRDKSLNRFEIVSSLGSIYEKVSIAHGIVPADVKFYTQLITNSASEQMNANHEFDITNMIKHVPSGTTLYKHELMGSINGSYGSGDIDIVGGYIISTDSAPLSDIASLYHMLSVNGSYISTRLQVYDYSSADYINIDRLIPGTSNSWLALSGGNYSAYQVHLQLELPTCSLIDTVTEL